MKSRVNDLYANVTDIQWSDEDIFGYLSCLFGEMREADNGNGGGGSVTR